MKNIKKQLRHFAETGFFHIFGGSVVNRIVAFLSSVVIVRILTKEEYGVFTHAWNIYSIILLLNGLGVAAAVLQMCSERSGDKDYARRVCNYATRFGLLFDLLIAAALLMIGTFVPQKIQGAGTLLQLLCFLPILRLLFDLISSYLRSQKRNQDFARLNMIDSVIVLVISAAGSLLFREKGMILGYYIAYLLTILLGFGWMKIRLLHKDAPLAKPDRKALRKIAFVSMCNAGLSQLLYLLDILVLGIVDPEETILASYRVATIIPSALPFIPTALVTYIYPYFAQHQDDGSWCMKHYKQTLLGLGIFNLLICSVLIISAPWIVRLIFGAEYMDVVPIFQVLTASYFISGTFRILSGNLLVTQRKLEFNLFVAVFSGVVNVIADFLFIRWWGPMGAALATVTVVVLTSILNTVYLTYTFKKKTI